MDAQGVLDGAGVLVPHLFDGEAELQKPPLYYWLVALIGELDGGTVDALAVRLPAAISALGCVLGLATLGLYCGRARAGLLAGIVLSSAAHFTWLARIGRIDMPLTLTTGVAVVAAFLALRRNNFVYSPFSEKKTAFLPSPCTQGEGRKRLFLFIAYLSAAVGVLLKGPIGFVLPAAAIATYLCFESEWSAWLDVRAWLGLLRRTGLWWGMPLVLALTLPWFVAADLGTDGDLFRVFVWHHNIERGFGGGQLRSNPWWFYGPQFIVDFLPWSPLMIAALIGIRRHRLLRDDPLARFGLAWFVGVFVVLSCARFKRADYLLPAYPGAALFLGCVFTHLAERWQRGWIIDRLLPIVLAGVMVVVWLVRLERVLPAQEPFRDYRPMASVIRQKAPPPAEVVFFRTEAHALAFRVGRPLAILVEWSDLAGRLARPGPHYVVMPPDCVVECRRYLPDLHWQEVTSTTELAGGAHERPLLLLQAVR